MKILNWLKKLGEKITYPFRYIWKNVYNFYGKLRRSCIWFVRMWNNYDWDHNFLIEMMVWKMKDMRHQFDVTDRHFINLRNQPVSIFNSTDEMVDNLKGLDEAIDIGERILKNDYMQYTPSVEQWYKEHEYEWLGGDKMPDDLHQELMECYIKSERDEKNDRNKFFETIRDEHQKWWD